MNGKNGKKSNTLKKVLLYLRGYRKVFVISLILAGVTVFSSLRIPILVGRAIDAMDFKDGVAMDTIVRLLIEIGILTLIGAAAQWLMSLCNNRLSFGVVHNVRRDAFHRIQKLPLSYLDTHQVGDTVNRVISDADTFADGLLVGFTQLFTGVVTIIGTLILMIRIQPVIAVIVIVVTPLSLFVAKFIASHTHRMFIEQSTIRGRQTAYMNEIIGNQKLVRAFGREDTVTERFDEIGEKLRVSSLRATFFSSLTNPSTRFINGIVYALVALFGAMVAIGKFSFLGGAITVGALASFLSYANQYTKPFNEIAGVVTELQNAFACAERLFELSEAEPELLDAENAAVLSDVKGAVTLDHVYFAYTPERPLITDVSVSAKPGMRVAIVGPTGCGKTTLINLLMRFYDVDGGAVTVDGQDIRSVTRSSLRENYGMVLQESWLKHATVRENIALARPDATEEEIVSAAKAAHAHGFIRRLENGYDTVIGDDGGMLSQGQKQLLCIARIMLSLPPILILDEATSSIDTRTEAAIQSAFATLMRGRTSFIVAHRLSTIREADLILVMKDGNIIEKGTHESLLRENGFYATLYQSQFEQPKD